LKASNRFFLAKLVYVYDPYGTKDGFGESLAAALAEKGFKGQLVLKAIPNVFVHHDTIDNQLALSSDR
jgi:hypothetical protein